MVVREIPKRPSPSRKPLIIAVIVAILIGGRTLASYTIEYEWWKEMNQLGTWAGMLLYGIGPMIAATLLVFAVLWISHARGIKFAGSRLRDYSLYAKVSTIAILLLSIVIALSTMESWTVVRYLGARNLSTTNASWIDPVFSRPLSFYLFDLPFYSDLLGLLLGITFFALVIYWLTARGWQLRHAFPQGPEDRMNFDLRDLRLHGAMESFFLRGVATVLLLALAGRIFLSRFSMLLNDHRFMVGIDYVNQNIDLPLRWASIAACLIAVILVWTGRLRYAVALAVVPLLQYIVPGIVSGVYVSPNEISIERPYIARHIAATRSAFGIEGRVAEKQYPAKLETRIDVAKHKPTLDNVRLWDWRAFHDTITQIQALRQYYTFKDTDVDRYQIDGQLRQVLLAPRELDVRQLADARANWINPHFIYTHGYGLVMAEANRITPSGQPVLIIQDAPPKVNTRSLKLTRPELYYGEKTHEPVFVRTKQPEFNYPAGADNVHSQYEGKGGIPISSLFMRLASAVSYGDWNILLTGYFTGESRMLINRDVKHRLETLANFIQWDADPYLVITDAGRMVWMVDGYTTSNQHPYSRLVQMGDMGTVNYIRNSVKATVDAYDGRVNLYVFDPKDPIIQAWQSIFPKLFQPSADMPADLRRHARYPEMLFRVQAEIYRTFHMQNPESFYNKEDLWDIAKNISGQNKQPENVEPTFVIATLPGEQQAEYLLMQSFTPRSKDNLIGVMMARCDGEHLGEIEVLMLSKQNLMYGPLQIEAKIDSDQNISKDLSLWNQQGSSVLRGQMLVLPIEDTFLYIEPIYIQSSQTRMPQLKKVVVAMGNTIIYKDTYEQALAELAGASAPAAPAAETQTTSTAAPAPTKAESQADPRLENIRGHLRRYRELSAQGKWAEAGKELEAIEAAVGKQ
jgi:uncharacterized membrane protein (UPF0182 family)